MKIRLINKWLIMSSLVLSSLAGLPHAGFSQEKELAGTVTISGAWAIYPTAVAWAEAFRIKYPKVKVDVSAGGAGKGVSDALAGFVDIGMVSRDPDPAELARGIIPLYILHDAVYPVTSDKNPLINDLMKKGITKSAWQGIYLTGLIKNWADLTGKPDTRPLHVYTRSDSCGAAASWAAFLGKKQEDLKGVGVYGDPGILDAAKRDPVGVAYTNFSFIFTREGNVLKGLKLIPIDANGNGVADADEVYDSRAKAIQAIRAGKYPATRKNYFFVKGKPKGLVKEFIRFALSAGGAKVVDEVGTSLPLTTQEAEQVLKELD
jgi:phosphate transport system substrate-binding protein